MTLTKKRPAKKAAKTAFEVPPTKFSPRIGVHSDESGCHADCRACGWRNPDRQTQQERDKAAHAHEKRCKAPLPVPTARVRKKPLPTRSRPQKAVQRSRKVERASQPTTFMGKKHDDLQRFLSDEQKEEVAKHIETIIQGTKRKVKK